MPEACVIKLGDGRVGGAEAEGVRQFLGVPFAAAPIGDLRFAEPAPAPPWSGVRDATGLSPTAPQFHRAFPKLDLAPLVGGGWVEGDDYLTLNIWAPPAQAGPGRPVLVWLHGGAFALGSKDAAAGDGSAFARSGVVCVAVTYRVGVEGFMPLEGAPSNLGLRDQLAALAWVKRNITAFGGDPANVTLCGESAGAMCVADLVTSPLAQDLFKRAIIQSGHGGMVRSLASAQMLARCVARLLGVEPTRDAFRTKSTQEIVAAAAEVSAPQFDLDLREADGRDPSLGLSRFLPVVGDEVLPIAPLAALAQGVGADKPLLIGTNREEMNLYYVPTGVRAAIDERTAEAMLARVQPRAGELLAAFGAGEPGAHAGDVLTRAMHDTVFRWPARRFAEAHNGRSLVYEFDWRSPALDGELGACHGLEVPFVFQTLDTCTGVDGLAGEAPPRDLSDRMHRIWVDFITSGVEPWPVYTSDDRRVYSLTRGEAVTEPPSPAAPLLP